MQNRGNTALLSSSQGSAGSHSVTPEIFEKSMIVHAVRLLPKSTWDKDRDQFYQPYTDDLPEEFINDCVIWSAFATSNNTVSLKDVEYKGQVYQIHNEMFPFLLSEISTWKCGLQGISNQIFAANEDRFLAKWIAEHTLSSEAQDLMSKAKELYKCVYSKLATISWLDYKIELWDIGWYQIKEAAKVIREAEPLLDSVRKSVRELADKIAPQISQYGFLPPDISYFTE